MKEILPDAKLIVILRNPVDHAYSNYHMRLEYSQESLSFEKVIKLEEALCAKGWEQLFKAPDFVMTGYRPYSYLARGFYSDQLENWFRYYGREKFLILATEDFCENRQRTLDQVFDFLGVRPFQIENPQDINVRNYRAMDEDTRKFLIEYFKPHNARLYKLLQRDFDWDR